LALAVAYLIGILAHGVVVRLSSSASKLAAAA
jgi:hypothetical protein